MLWKHTIEYYMALKRKMYIYNIKISELEINRKIGNEIFTACCLK